MEAKPVDPGQFRIGMRTLAGAVNIITSSQGGRRYGMTATAVCSATAEPPTVLVCINKIATTHAAVAMESARREANLERKVESRDLIGRAKGIVMSLEHVSDEEAFEVLREVSQRLNVKLAAVAQHVSDSRQLPR